MPTLKLKKHPRLFAKSDMTAYLQEHLGNPYVKREADAVLADADKLVRQKPITWDDIEGPLYPTSHQIASQVENLVGAWALTRDPRYRKAAFKRVEALTGFARLSCEANTNQPPEQEDWFCLTYGWHAVAIGYMHDMFSPDLTDEEDAIIMALLDKHLMKRAEQCLTNPPWWVNAGWTNWNGVCAGGMGILALSFYDRLPAARKLVPFVDKSLDAYLGSYSTNGGGCPEGTGYYNYGMQFAIPYLNCWESATGRKHPAMKLKELGTSLNFPMDFHRITFGDNDGWGPTGYHFWLAERMNQPVAALKAASFWKVDADGKSARKGRVVDANRGTLLYVAGHVPTPKEVEAFRKKHAEKKPVARVYKGMGWGSIADDDAFPTLRMTVRGNTTAQAGHASQDQFSFKCMVNGEVMIADQHDRPGVSFTKRGNDVYGRSSPSKSGLFVEGLGCDLHAETDSSEVVKGKGITGIRVEGAGCYLKRWQNAFIGRLFLLVDGRYWVGVDRQSAGGNCMEARFHTFAEGKHGRDWVRLKSGKERMTMSFASFDKAVLQTSAGLPTWADEQTTIYRWITAERKNDNVLVTALNPGNKKLGIKLTREPRGSVTIEITEPDQEPRVIRVSKQLRLLG
ncbi:MAG: hypothetical protein HN919_06315 [Verrucomicrobia bacterium]|jgi:hypothetical protein|nr:hypothetical protein [Verrucomicrobiota bacterium]MBT7700083.1 hypothetical protein [Verrucomicrobiota bacterium]